MTNSSVEKIDTTGGCKSICKTAKGEVVEADIYFQLLELKLTLKTLGLEE
jgi:hypothetical protein